MARISPCQLRACQSISELMPTVQAILILISSFLNWSRALVIPRALQSEQWRLFQRWKQLVSLYDSIPQPLISVTLGTEQYRRLLAAGSADIASGKMLSAVEILKDDGPWVTSGNVDKLNINSKYSPILMVWNHCSPTHVLK